MPRFLRVLALAATVGLCASIAGDEIPSPFFPPDPWEDLPPAFAAAADEIPSPFFPPDPWEDLPPV